MHIPASTIKRKLSVTECKSISMLSDVMTRMMVDNEAFRVYFGKEVQEITLLNCWNTMIDAEDDLSGIKNNIDSAFAKLILKYNNISFERKHKLLILSAIGSIKDIIKTQEEKSFLLEAHSIFCHASSRIFGCVYSAAGRSMKYYLDKIVKTAKLSSSISEDEPSVIAIFDSISILLGKINDNIEQINNLKNG